MSDTPLSSFLSKEAKHFMPNMYVVPAFALEQLERENAALRERLEILSKSQEKQTEEYICVDREHGLWKRATARKEAQP